MGLFDNWPYVNFHEINLDYVVKLANEAKERLDGYDEDVAEIAASKVAAENAATAAANSKNAAASSASTASTKASQAAASATAAANSAAAALNSQNAAASSASSANSSKTAAASSASNAHASELAAASSESNAHDSELAAAASESAAGDSADQAEAWAVGEIDGVPVDSSAQQYHNNAKYYCEQSQPAAVDAYAPYSIGACYTVSVRNTNVLANRTVTMPDGTTTTLNVPGLIIIASPLEGFINDQTIKNGQIASAGSCEYRPILGYGTADPYYHYVIIPFAGPAAYKKTGGKAHKIVYLRAFDLNSNTWAADNTGITFNLVITNGYNATQLDGESSANIGDSF